MIDETPKIRIEIKETLQRILLEQRRKQRIGTHYFRNACARLTLTIWEDQVIQKLESRVDVIIVGRMDIRFHNVI